MAPRDTMYRAAAAFDGFVRRVNRAVESNEAVAFAIVARHRLFERAMAAAVLYFVYMIFAAASTALLGSWPDFAWVICALFYAVQTIPRLFRDWKRYHHERNLLAALAAVRRHYGPDGVDNDGRL